MDFRVELSTQAQHDIAAEAFYYRALGLDKTVWSYPGALFLSAGGYHHHLGTNVWSPGPAQSADQAHLLEWELLVPSNDDVAAVARSIRTAGYTASDSVDGVTAKDPWGTTLRIRAEGLSSLRSTLRKPRHQAASRMSQLRTSSSAASHTSKVIRINDLHDMPQAGCLSG